MSGVPPDPAPDGAAAAVWARLGGWPLGWFTARYAGRRYGVSRTVHAGGRSMKLYAEELGGPDRISLNIFAAPAGARGAPTLRLCEMPRERVTAFVLGAAPDA
jgi:hypothetical protein